ncbi:MAG: tetratricopeptide repeat protein [Phycisphaerales bacterium]|nr:MAG: tetratricopeptide repeat protein [Phycisphaerales bacterium]
MALVCVAAVVVGLPSLRGSFVGGDDHRLALNHVLVNHPSFAHAVKLFTITHRDLYQPVPLLSFQAEFAIANALGLFKESLAGGAWLFHLTNILLHTLNAVLVWMLILRLHERAGGAKVGRANGGSVWDVGNAAPAVATVSALLFAIHPLQMEVIAWTNGRMMLLSTLFTLLSLLSFGLWVDRPRAGSAIITIVFVLLSAISKVRIGLPILLLIVALARRAKLDRKLILLWVACALVTGVFVLVNAWATASAALFTEAAEHLQGPRMVRVLLALACYFQHFVWPAGLASYYPTPPLVRWSDPETWRAAVVVALGLVVLAWACRRSRVARLGVLWFFVTIGITLPFIPARNILAADRYMYLPIIGLLWMVATLGCAVYRHWLAARAPRSGPVLAVLVAVAVIPACVGIGWHVGDFYATPVKKTKRIVTLFPDTPRVWERLGWTLFSQGDYKEAMDCARKELEHDSPNVQSGAYQLLGMCELRRGNGDAALEFLHEAIEVDPDNSLGLYRLAIAYDDLGRTTEAVTYFEAAVDAAPLHNPRINRLASVYRRQGRPSDARAMYERALANNEYEVPAAMGLAELDIELGTPESYLAAERRLTALLGWMPENTDALTNLGAVRRALGRTREAIEAYREALDREPGHVTAALNLAQVYYGSGAVERALPLFDQAVAGGLESFDQAVDAHEFYVAQGLADRSVSLWEGLCKRFPDVVDGRHFLAWSRALAGDLQQAKSEAVALLDAREESALPLATLAYVDLAQGRYEDATTRVHALCKLGEKAVAARHRLLGALAHFDREHPDIAWTFCLATQLLIADGNFQGAELFLGLCEQRCRDLACREQARSLASQVPDSGSTEPDASEPP